MNVPKTNELKDSLIPFRSQTEARLEAKSEPNLNKIPLTGRFGGESPEELNFQNLTPGQRYMLIKGLNLKNNAQNIEPPQPFSIKEEIKEQPAPNPLKSIGLNLGFLSLPEAKPQSLSARLFEE